MSTLFDKLIEAQKRADIALSDERKIVEEMQDKTYKERKTRELLFDHVLMESSLFDKGMRKILDVLDVQRGVELAMAEVGNYKFTDDDHCDFEDGSECKTVGMKLVTTSKSDGYSFRYQVTNCVTAAGTPKSGDIRLVMVNVFNETVRYFFLPKNKWDGDNPMWSQSKGFKGTINGGWPKVGQLLTTSATGVILDDFEVGTFVELAKRKITC